MKKSTIRTIATLMTIIIVGTMSGCRTKSVEYEQSVYETKSTQEITQENTVQEETTKEEVTEETHQAESENVEVAVVEEAPGPVTEIIGVSANGYQIIAVDGVAYINGVLIANKTYALPPSYGPGDIYQEVKNAFAVMQNAAAQQGLNIYISSGFRSYQSQKYIYNNYVSIDGQQLADTYSARAGHSEHQTGLCFDLNTIDDSFANTPESVWLERHAQEYGFIIRYPKEKQSITGYQYEPWHLRYLGTELATAVYNSGLCLEEYLGITSDYVN